MQSEFNAVFARIEAKFRAKKIPKLKTLFRGASNNVTNLCNLLVRKSYLKENLYNYSSEDENTFFLPDEKVFIDNEKPRVMYDRLKAFINALEFQANSLSTFDIEEISDNFIDNTYKLLSFFNFSNLSSSNAGINTRTLKEMTDKILQGKDNILKRVVQDNLKLLTDNFNKIKSNLEELVIYKKEKYKALIRFKIFPYLQDNLNEKLLQENPSEFLKRLSRYMTNNTPEININKQWIAESIKSCFTQKPEEALEKLKNSFLDDRTTPDVTANVYSPREKLLSIIKFLAHSSDSLEKIYIKLEQNLKLLLNRKKGFFEQLVYSLKKAINISYSDEMFQLEYINPTNKSIQNEMININDFMLSVKKKIILFKTMLNESSSVYDKIKRGTEDALYKLIEDKYYDLLLTKERIMGINAEIRLRLSKKEREKIKEIKEYIEILDNILLKISEARRKYVIEQDKEFFKNPKKT